MPDQRLLLVLALLAGSAARVASAQAPASERVTLGADKLFAGIPGEWPLTAAPIRAWLDDPRNHRELRPRLPVGLDEGAVDLRIPAENRLTRAKIELGRQLFFDKRFSQDGAVSCASCHAPEHGYAFPTPHGVGVHGQQGRRNAPTAGNRALSGPQFWDGRAASLEEQAVGPLANPMEMGFTHDAVVETCERIEGYRLQFDRLFPDGVTISNVGRALASFERALLSGPSPWDHHRRLARFERAFEEEIAYDELEEDLGAEHAELKRLAAAKPLSEAAERGAALFFSSRTGCTQCHAGANFTDERYHNLGIGMEPLAGLGDGEPIPADLEAAIDWGRYAVTDDESDRGAFKTPSLRNVAQTAPYLHDGSLATLADVIALYNEGGRPNRYLSPLIEPLDLNEQEQADLVAFLESLSGDWPVVETDRLPSD